MQLSTEQVMHNMELARRGGRSYTPAEVMAELCEVYLSRQWRPIDTAPKDGSVILTANSAGLADNRWLENRWATDSFRGPWTHWMPAPPLPD